jgi:rod shape-determining protein MreB
VFDQALGRLSTDVAIDLGTSNTRAWVRGRGVVVEMPSVVAVERSGSSGKVVAVGAEAKRMVGRTPENMQAVTPIREGIIGDYALAEALLRDCMSRALSARPLVRPRVLIPVPTTSTDVERRAVQESARSCGAREVLLVTRAVAAAVGADLPIGEASANVVVDLGGGLTEIAIISLGGVVEAATLRVGGTALDQAIAGWIRDRHNVLVGSRAAEEVKLVIGCATRPLSITEVRVTGRDLTTGIPREVLVSSDDALAAVQGPLDRFVEGIRVVLSRLSPELSADVADHGIVLTGGTALLPGLDAWLRERTGVPVVVAEEPRLATILGAGRLLEDAETLDRVLLG